MAPRTRQVEHVTCECAGASKLLGSPSNWAFREFTRPGTAQTAQGMSVHTTLNGRRWQPPGLIDQHCRRTPGCSLVSERDTKDGHYEPQCGEHKAYGCQAAVAAAIHSQGSSTSLQLRDISVRNAQVDSFLLR